GHVRREAGRALVGSEHEVDPAPPHGIHQRQHVAARNAEPVGDPRRPQGRNDQIGIVHGNFSDSSQAVTGSTGGRLWSPGAPSQEPKDPHPTFLNSYPPGPTFTIYVPKPAGNFPVSNGEPFGRMGRHTTDWARMGELAIHPSNVTVA